MMKFDIVNVMNSEIIKLEKDFKSGNWFVLYYQAAFIEAILKTFLIQNAKREKRLIRYYENKNFVDLIKLCYVNLLIDENLHDKLEEYRRMRNRLVHELFEEETLKSKLNINEMYETGKQILTELLKYVKQLVKVNEGY